MKEPCTDAACTRAHYSTRVHVEGRLVVPGAVEICMTIGAEVDDGCINSHGKDSEAWVTQIGTDEPTARALRDALLSTLRAFVAQHGDRIIFTDGLEDCIASEVSS